MDIRYIELKTGYSDNGPAWIGNVKESKSGRTIYFNDHAFQKFDNKGVVATAIISVAAALLLFPGDKMIFGHFSSWVYDQYNVSPGLPKIISGLLVGGVIEEVMMRLFFMSLLVLIISILFHKHEERVPVRVFYFCCFPK